jgi:hypothetical protein
MMQNVFLLKVESYHSILAQQLKRWVTCHILFVDTALEAQGNEGTCQKIYAIPI